MNHAGIIRFIAARLRKSRKLVHLLRVLTREISPDTVLLLDYPLSLKQRWDLKKPHSELYAVLDKNREIYYSHLRSFLTYAEFFLNISDSKVQEPFSMEPSWNNGWTPALDGIALYSFLVTNKPKYYLEIGSGNSTKFARKAITDHALDTKIISIDPYPRAEIDNICDEIIREPVENVNIEIFDRLNANDILYIDNSHRAFMNSDVTVLFLDVIPRLKPGVLVEFHDVTLPYDYPADWVDRYYSEQYLLASYILAKGERFEIVLPNYFISYDSKLRDTLSPIWKKEELKNVAIHGCSFWIRIR